MTCFLPPLSLVRLHLGALAVLSAGGLLAVPTGASAETMSFVPAADAYVSEAEPSRNFGTSTSIKADGSPKVRSYLRFDIGQLDGKVVRASLKLYAHDTTQTGVTAQPVLSGNWAEGAITYANAPARGEPVASSGPFSAGTWTSIDVTRLVEGKGAVDIALGTSSTYSKTFSSRETGAQAPKLEVETDGSTDTVSPPADSSGPPTASVETAPVPHSGDAADDPAVWIHPTDPAKSTIIGTDKQGGLGVYDLDGRQLHYIADSKPNNVDIRHGFKLEGQPVDLVTTSDRSNNSIRIYKIDPATRGLVPVAARTITPASGLYGICMYRSAKTGKHYVFTTTKGGVVQQWELFESTGKVDAREVRRLSHGSTTEGCVADDELGQLYVGEEVVAIWKYGAEPTAGTAHTKVDGPKSSGGHLTPDIEGLSIYHASDGTGYLLASSQGSNRFVAYERGGSNAYVKTFPIEAGSVDGLAETDGIDVTPVNLSPAFPKGMFVAQDGYNDTGNQNFKLVPWERIAESGTPLKVDTAWNPRNASPPTTDGST